MSVAFTVREKRGVLSGEPQVVINGPRAITQPKPRRGIQLNPKYTFKNFVVGAGNQFAHAACMAVAEQLGHTL